MFVFPSKFMLTPNPQSYGGRRGTLRGLFDGQKTVINRMTAKKESQEACKKIQGEPLTRRKVGVTRTWHCCHSNCRFPASITMRNSACCL